MSKQPGNTASMNINSLSMGRRGGSRAEDNTADRFELFLLGDGEKKVTEEADTRKSTVSQRRDVLSTVFGYDHVLVLCSIL